MSLFTCLDDNNGYPFDNFGQYAAIHRGLAEVQPACRKIESSACLVFVNVCSENGKDFGAPFC